MKDRTYHGGDQDNDAMSPGDPPDGWDQGGAPPPPDDHADSSDAEPTISELEQILKIDMCSAFTRQVFAQAKATWPFEKYEFLLTLLVEHAHEPFYDAAYRYCTHLAEEFVCLLRRHVGGEAAPEQAVSNPELPLCLVWILVVDLTKRSRKAG